jgi:hypothetical protein
VEIPEQSHLGRLSHGTDDCRRVVAVALPDLQVVTTEPLPALGLTT